MVQDRGAGAADPGGRLEDDDDQVGSPADNTCTAVVLAEPKAFLDVDDVNTGGSLDPWLMSGVPSHLHVGLSWAIGPCREGHDPAKIVALRRAL